MRLEWNKQDPNYLATFMVDSRRTIILDIRVPSLPVAELGGHLGCVNATAWAPHSSCHICTAGDDSQALIWDLSAMPKPVEDPILAYNADGEINNLQWSASQPDWVSIAFNDKLQIRKYYKQGFVLFRENAFTYTLTFSPPPSIKFECDEYTTRPTESFKCHFYFLNMYNNLLAKPICSFHHSRT